MNEHMLIDSDILMYACIVWKIKPNSEANLGEDASGTAWVYLERMFFWVEWADNGVWEV